MFGPLLLIGEVSSLSELYFKPPKPKGDNEQVDRMTYALSEIQSAMFMAGCAAGCGLGLISQGLWAFSSF